MALAGLLPWPPLATQAAGPAPMASLHPGGDAALARQLDDLLAPYLRADAPGATVIVTRHGQVLLRRAYGLQDVQRRQAMRPDAVMRIASMTKQFTAVAVMMLVDRGLLRLDDDFTQHLPAYPKPRQRVTVEQLLTHTAGLPNYGEPQDLPTMQRAQSLPQLLARFQHKPLDFEPGTQYRYSNANFVVLGALIEALGGLPYAGFLARHVLRPLGLRHTGVEGQGPVPVAGYTGSPQVKPAPHMHLSAVHAAGAMVSNVDDLARWDAAIAQGRLLRAASWQRVFRTHRLANGQVNESGLGWNHLKLGDAQGFWHNGGIPGFNSSGIRLPEQGLYSAVLMNTDEPWVPASTLNRMLAVVAAGQPLPWGREKLHLRGTLNDWGTTLPLASQAGHRHVVDVDLPAGPMTFKLASEDWSSLDFGAMPGDEALAPGVTKTLLFAGKNLQTLLPQAGRWRLVVDSARAWQPTLTMQALPP
jgi:CubicO group peptidase (beta-lactamase class C family)